LEETLRLISRVVIEIGLPAGLVLFFVWRDFAREKSLADYIRVQESFTRDKLLAIIQSDTNLVNLNITCLRDFMQTIIRLYDTLAMKPCLSEALVKENLELRMRIQRLEADLAGTRNA